MVLMNSEAKRVSDSENSAVPAYVSLQGKVEEPPALNNVKS